MQAMTTPQTPLGADPGHTPKPRMPNGPYWLLATAGVLVFSLVASWLASSIPLVFDGPHLACVYHTDGLAADLAKVGFFAGLAAGLSSLYGLLAAWGWRWWFLPLLIVSPVAMIVGLFATFYYPPGCPGPFS